MELQFSDDKRTHANHLWEECTQPERVISFSQGENQDRHFVYVCIKAKGEGTHCFENVPREIYLKFKQEVEDFWRNEKPL